MVPDNPSLQMTVLFLIMLAMLGCAMKLTAPPPRVGERIERRGISWVLVSPHSVMRSQPVSSVRAVVVRMLLLFGAVATSYWIYWALVRGFHFRGIALSYLAAPILLLMSEFLVSVETLVFLPGGRLIPALHRRPWLARSVAEFWGDRWNLWFRDWFRHAVFARLRRRPVLALFVVFAISGIMHEWVINAPLYIVTGVALFGTMMIYFLLQGVGILWERRFLKDRPRLMVSFAWLIIFAPSPLVLNEGLLRVLHLWPE